jgi:hypothetical protein
MEHCKGKRSFAGAYLKRGGELMAVYGDFSYKKKDRRCVNLYHCKGHNAAADLPPDIRECDAPPPEKQKSESKIEKSALFSNLIDEFLDGGIDSDKLLVAVILYLLVKEGADIKLIIALGYILM